MDGLASFKCRDRFLFVHWDLSIFISFVDILMKHKLSNLNVASYYPFDCKSKEVPCLFVQIIELLLFNHG
jgi:hypothetical protein